MKPKNLQKMLGHISQKMIMDLYCHVLDDTLKEEMGLVMEMVNKLVLENHRKV